MIYLLIGTVAVISPFIGIAEPVAVFSALSSKLNWVVVVLALCLGQTLGFTLMYVFGDRFVARWVWLAKKLEAVKLEKYRDRRNVCTFLGALVGMPPLTALALAGPMYEPRFRVFIGITFAGRLTRFFLFAGAATFFADFVEHDALPGWLQPYF